MKKLGKLFVVLSLLAIVLGTMAFMPAQEPPPEDGEAQCVTEKVWVCKYSGQPGVDEFLKPGKNPIAVSSNATVGTYFNDAQGRSYVLDVQTDENTGPDNTYIGGLSCPPGDAPDEPEVQNLKLTFMQPCEPSEGQPEKAEWRVRNPNDFAVAYTVEQAGSGQIESGTAPAGDSFFYTAWGTQTLILKWADGSTTKAGGDSYNGTLCEPEPVIENLKLTFMQPCEPTEGEPAQAEWRVRNPNDFAVDYTVDKAGTGQILSGTAPAGDSFFYTAWGTQTLILKWANDSTTKSGGDSFNGTMCPAEVADLKLTFMQPCEPVDGEPAQAEWRVRNPNDFAVEYSVEKAGEEEILSGVAPAGDSFFYTDWGSQTLILKWEGGSNTKAGGDSYNGTVCPVDEPTPVPEPPDTSPDVKAGGLGPSLFNSILIPSGGLGILGLGGYFFHRRKKNANK